MAIVNRLEQKAHLDKGEIIKFQLLIHCFFKNINLTTHEMECLCLLAQDREADLNGFCRFVAKNELYASAQSVRNVLNKLERIGLIHKTGKKNKRIRLSSEIPMQTEGNILLEYKFAHIHEAGQI